MQVYISTISRNAVLNPQIDESRVQDARETVGFMCSRVQPDGFLLPPSHWPALSSTYRDRQKQQDGCSIACSADDWTMSCGRLTAEAISPTAIRLPENWQEQKTCPDARYTAATLLSSAIYFTVTGDDSFNELARRSMTAMFDEWDFMTDDFIHVTREFVILSVLVWGGPMTEYFPKSEPLVQWVLESFVDTASRDFPFLTSV